MTELRGLRVDNMIQQMDDIRYKLRGLVHISDPAEGTIAAANSSMHDGEGGESHKYLRGPSEAATTVDLPTRRRPWNELTYHCGVNPSNIISLDVTTRSKPMLCSLQRLAGTAQR